jgi:hypothetical protein
LTSVKIKPNPAKFDAETPRALFKVGVRHFGAYVTYSVARDNTRFLVAAPDSEGDPSLVLVLNWAASARPHQ